MSLLQKYSWNKLENIKIKPYKGNDPDLDDLTMLSYKIETDFTKAVHRECRGIIFDKDRNIVCRAFDKFGNLHEPYAAKLDFESTIYLEKIDGSLIKVYYYKGKWRIATNNSINARETCIMNSLTITFAQLFCSVVNMKRFEMLNTNRTYIFELVSPKTQVVIPYPETEVYFLGTRDNITGREQLPVNYLFPECRTPTIYSFKNIQAAVQNCSEMDWKTEGYVAVDKTFNRVKIKSPEYVKVHRVATNTNLSLEKFLEVMNTDKFKEVCVYFPELIKKKNLIESLTLLIKEKLQDEIDEYVHEYQTRKAFALSIVETEFRPLLFMKYSKPELTLDQLLSRKLVDYLKKEM